MLVGEGLVGLAGLAVTKNADLHPGGGDPAAGALAVVVRGAGAEYSGGVPRVRAGNLVDGLVEGLGVRERLNSDGVVSSPADRNRWGVCRSI